MLRGVDHIVLAVSDLDAARTLYEALGFIVTPTAYHPFGTKNALVQLDGAFLELLAVHDESLMPEPREGSFSFARFNQSFLHDRQGASMLVLKSDNVARDLVIFNELELETYPPFDFEREAEQPDGSKKTVSFSNGFLHHPLMKHTGFFVCHHRHDPEHFWKPDYQYHANGAQRLESVLFLADNPSDHHEFLGGFSGQRIMRSTSAGVVVDTGHGLLEVLTPSAAKVFYDLDVPTNMPLEGGIAALNISVDLQKTEELLAAAQIDYFRHNDLLVVQPETLFGCGLLMRAK
ncbi:VOC family protein [Cohaesibacter celericrescens]|uniref:VOC family protein n=1 Tax=Cohaesibacter celericrescens TaxID=2067669 RepID=A0A2N5XST7_9HYPH|nr:VOC family protein [Cohaesibacter celericrescens]PLW77564.1 VOC family protein [Cohaesibacter celericrescens]